VICLWFQLRTLGCSSTGVSASIPRSMARSRTNELISAGFM